ncbi:RNA polymerase sigma factor [Ilyomonas limi]|nr:sigma-70 family RNA polymerase sigma factor [Ilyomonas limi]
MQIVRNYSDAELISALKHPTEMDVAISLIYKEYYALLENYVINNKGSKEDAADIIQETIVAFIGIVEQDKYRGDASIKSFLYAITRNLWLAELRKRSSADNRNRIFEKAKDDTEQATIQHLVQREYFAVIQQFFEKLGTKCRQLLMLVYYEDLSMSDIVQQMPDYQNEQVLRNKKYKCMKQLEQMIQNDQSLRTQLKNALRYAG